MSKLSPAKPDDLVRVLEGLGFKRIRQSGHAEGILFKILKDIGITYEEFKKLK